jgi:hypothetical protein
MATHARGRRTAPSSGPLDAALVAFVDGELSRRSGGGGGGGGSGRLPLAVPASRIGGSFLSKFSKASKHSALKGKRLLPYLAGIFSLWKTPAAEGRLHYKQETWVARAGATLPRADFVLVSRPPGRKAVDRPAAAPPSPGAALDPDLCRFIAKAIGSSGTGCVAVSKVGGTFLSRNHALRGKLRKASKKLADYLRPAYSLWQMRSDLHKKPAHQETFAAPPRATLSLSDFVLVSRPAGRASAAAAAATTATAPITTNVTTNATTNAAAATTTATAPTTTNTTTTTNAITNATTTTNANGATTNTAGTNTDPVTLLGTLSKPRLAINLHRFVTAQLSTSHGAPIAARTLGKKFRADHPAFCDSDMGKKLLQVLCAEFSLWQKQPKMGKPSLQGEIFVAHANTEMEPGFVLLSRPDDHSREHEHNPYDFPALLPSTHQPAAPMGQFAPSYAEKGSSNNNRAEDGANTPPPPPPPLLPGSPLTGSPGLSDVVLDTSPLQWSFVVRQDYESNNTAKLTSALLSTDLTREDMAQNVAALLSHFRHSGSFDVFRDVSNHRMVPTQCFQPTQTTDHHTTHYSV